MAGGEAGGDGDRTRCTPSPLYTQMEVSNPTSCQRSPGTSATERDGQENRFGVAQQSAGHPPRDVSTAFPLPCSQRSAPPPHLSSEHRPGAAQGKVTGCVPAARGLGTQVLVAPRCGLAQRHTKGREPGGCATISSLVTGSHSLPQGLIAARSLWQHSWCS